MPTITEQIIRLVTGFDVVIERDDPRCGIFNFEWRDHGPRERHIFVPDHGYVGTGELIPGSRWLEFFGLGLHVTVSSRW